MLFVKNLDLSICLDRSSRHRCCESFYSLSNRIPNNFVAPVVRFEFVVPCTTIPTSQNIMSSIIVCLSLAITRITLVGAQQSNFTGNGTVPAPTLSPMPTTTRAPFTWEPTTTFAPTVTPTRAPVPAPVPDRACYTNLTEIEDKNKLKNPFEVETFVLCPHTVFKIGVFGPDGEIVDGFDSLHPRSNTIYTCGEDGKSSNNCTFDGGQYHIYHSLVSYNRENKVGVVLKGITFNDSVEGGVILVAPGDITFIDCVFSVRTIGLLSLSFICH